MINFLSSIVDQDKFAEDLFKAQLAECYTIPEEPNFPEEEPEVPDPEPEPIEGSAGTKGRKRPERKKSPEAEEAQAKAKADKDKAKEETEKSKKEAKEASNKAKEDIKNDINNAVKNNPAKFKEYLAKLKNLGVSVGELSTSCVTLPSRLASLASSIIVVCPMGPGANVPAIPKGIQDLKQVGDDLGTKYDKVENNMDELGLNDVENLASNPVVGMMGLEGVVATATGIVSGITGLLGTVKPMIQAVGGSVGNSAGVAPTVDTPETAGYTASATSCITFSPLSRNEDGTYAITCENCKNYSAIDSEAPRTCQNCLKYKEKN